MPKSLSFFYFYGCSGSFISYHDSDLLLRRLGWDSIFFYGVFVNRSGSKSDW